VDRFMDRVREIEKESAGRLDGPGAAVTVGTVVADRPAEPGA